MKNINQRLIHPTALALAICLWLPAAAQSADPSPDAVANQQGQAQAQAQANPQIEQQRQEAEQQAQKTLDKDAVAAITETQNAVKALQQSKTDEALAAIERATGKINILLARNPATGLIPVEATVHVIDTAPLDKKAIKAIAKAAEKAVDDKDFPGARVLLQNLISEIRVRTYNLPLATYPIALKEAARLIDQKKPDEAKGILRVALNTLAVVDRVTPLPLVIAEAAITEAQAQRDKDKEAAQRHLAVARSELDRAKELGYAGNDPEYGTLSQAISDVESQIKGNQDSRSAFARLKERVSSFFKRQSESQKRAEVASK